MEVLLEYHVQIELILVHESILFLALMDIVLINSFRMHSILTIPGNGLISYLPTMLVLYPCIEMEY